jgi:hypothetical protein
MENKYYTPTIDEFHVGFTYERNDGNDWYPVVSNIVDMMDVQTMLSKANLQKIAITCKDEKEFLAKTGAHALPIGMTLKTILNNPITFCDRIRVKYLDREDIESLGFRREFDKFRPVDIFCGHLPNDSEAISHVSYNFDSKILFIQNNQYEDNSTIFLGAIKNKSELKKLMQQLNIK